MPPVEPYPEAERPHTEPAPPDAPSNGGLSPTIPSDYSRSDGVFRSSIIFHRYGQPDYGSFRRRGRLPPEPSPDWENAVRCLEDN